MIGGRLGSYEIVGALGAGGMGEVYRARDPRLGREVALKVLPADFAADPERLARFEREAKVLASLNHPHIAAIYGWEDSDGIRALVMELVEGPTLAERIEQGPLPLDETLAIARQIAEALEAAHERGVVHRDLKPANVKLSLDGQVKVLDFGLAKALDPQSSADLTASPTITALATRHGVILGTAAYMSPEQARGLAVDKRSDIWAFGCVVYEMLTGRRVFEGETVSDTLAAILRGEVDWSALPAGTPAALRKLLARCLEKDRRKRLHDIADARFELDESLAGAASGYAAVMAPTVAQPPAWRRALPWTLAAGLALAAVAIVAGYLLRRPSMAEVRKLDITDEGLSASDTHPPQLSPDGRRILYFAKGRLRVRELDRADARDLTGTEGARDAFWSADGREIGFHQNDGLYRIALAGGAPQLIAQTGPNVGGAGACWGPDGRIVFSRGNTPLFEVRDRGGEPRVLLEPDRARRDDHFHGCSFLPDGRGLLWVVHPRDSPANTIALLANGARRGLLTLPNEEVHFPTWAPSGHIVFHRGGGGRDGVWALPFSLARLEVTGEPFPIAPGAAAPSVSADGSLLYAPRRARQPTKLFWVSRAGKVERTAVEFPDELTGFDLSRDGKRVAAIVVEAAGANLWIADLERGSRTRLTSLPALKSGPAWSPDGSRVAYAENNQIFVVPADGVSEPRALGPGLQPVFTPDGRTILAHRPAASSIFELVELDVAAVQAPRTLLQDSVSLRYPALSQDGRFLAYDRGEGQDIDAVLTRFPELTGRWQISATGGTFLRWSPDGRRLFYFAAPQDDSADRWLVEVDMLAGQTPALGAPRPLFALATAGVAEHEYQLAPAGDRFLMMARERGDAIPRLVLVQNWFEEFGGNR